MRNTRFEELVRGKFIKEFCEGREGYHPDGLESGFIDEVDDNDADWFVRAIECGVVKQINGFFQAPKSKAPEQIFWSGEKSQIPRKLYLWVEPIITIGAMARPSQTFQWPTPN